ncbi:C4-dicarboxylate transporter malic acid transport protein [Musa troglodytarum]|uniref:C4-dicarboxylate transporter malic acid transport protein n=1 Tax=Musa troglodytarum TaxID=320322 RepID=A0A9E7GJM4_9LILI|nr:C4-dicarboxylate transporter malic acid transport protein [Musa troglodytarum]
MDTRSRGRDPNRAAAFEGLAFYGEKDEDDNGSVSRISVSKKIASFTSHRPPPVAMEAWRWGHPLFGSNRQWKRGWSRHGSKGGFPRDGRNPFLLQSQMDGKECKGLTKEGSPCPESFPSLFRYIATRSFADFDITHSPGGDLAFTKVREAISDNIQAKKLSISSPTSPIQMIEHYHVHSISISMPASPSAFDRERSRGILESEKGGSYTTNGKINHPTSATAGPQRQNQSKFHSQPMPIGNSHTNTSPDIKILDSLECHQQISWNSGINDRRYDSFKTWSGKLERQISNLRGKPQEPEEVTDAKNAKPEAVPAVGRYFDALEGPELDKLKASEELILPEDKKWPFLLRFQVSSFGMCLGISSQAILWKALATTPSMTFLHIIFYFEAVCREYYHPVRVNFFFAPWITCLFLAIGALLGASMGLKEGPIFFFAVGLAHYTVLFVTLYQRLPTNETLPKELHPVFFLFVAAPSVACMAWAKITGNFGYCSKIAYFTALFLFVSLAVRINFFRGFRFSLTWWAYTFPMTGASVATIRYSAEVSNTFTRTLSIALSAISTLTVAVMLVSTIIHAFIPHDLFPNDISIAITERRVKASKGRMHTEACASSKVENS